MIDFFFSTSLTATIVCVILFFWKKDPRYGYVAAVLLAAVPVVQLLFFFFSPKIDAQAEPARALAMPLIFLFDLLCALCAGIMFRLARKREDWM